jgi:hypothetical protein
MHVSLHNLPVPALKTMAPYNKTNIDNPEFSSIMHMYSTLEKQAAYTSSTTVQHGAHTGSLNSKQHAEDVHSTTSCLLHRHHHHKTFYINRAGT